MRVHQSLWLLALLCAACGSQSEPQTTVSALALRAAPSSAQPEVMQVTRRLSLGDGEWELSPKTKVTLAAWEESSRPGRDPELGVGAAASDPALADANLADSNAVSVMHLSKGTKATLSRRGPFEPESFNSLLLGCECTSYFSVSVQLYSRRKLVLSSRTRSIAPSNGLAPIVFEMPRAAALKKPVDQIVLKFTGVQRPVRMNSLDLLKRPMLSYLPDASSGGELVALGGESRRAVGLGTGAELSALLEVPHAAKLFLSLGLPSQLNVDVRQARMTMFLKREGEVVFERGFVLRSSKKPDEWTEVAVDLAEFAGQSLQASFHLEAAKNQEVVCALGIPELLVVGTDRPPVLMITSDTHRGDHLGTAGEGVEILTPVIDALAARGVMFEDCFTTINITNPSHIAIMTGTHPRDHGVLNNSTRIALAAPTLAEAFRDAGYTCLAAVSSKHLGDQTSGLGQGFARMSIPVGASTRDAPETVALASDWLDSMRGRPVFLWLHLFDAHTPYEVPHEYETRYYPSRERATDPDLPDLSEGMRKAMKRLKMPEVRDPELPRALYRAEISFLDQELTRLFEHPKLRTPIVAFTSDHGESLGDHGFHFTHNGLYRDILHVPLILSWPGAPAGTRVTGAVSVLDLGRTLLDLSGGGQVSFPGQNLQAWTDGSEVSPDARFALHALATVAAINQDGWHLLLNRPTLDSGHEVELYYLPEDPDCSHNRVEPEYERATAMRALLIRWLGKSQQLDWIGSQTDDAGIMASLNALGYATDETSSGETYLVGDECPCEWCVRF
ncbi:MAG: arylsulfatase A-like enzyme [Planctomycetota bacterium]|jgi:arylsulfatase A-like enzyme